MNKLVKTLEYVPDPFSFEDILVGVSYDLYAGEKKIGHWSESDCVYLGVPEDSSFYGDLKDFMCIDEIVKKCLELGELEFETIEEH